MVPVPSPHVNVIWPYQSYVNIGPGNELVLLVNVDHILFCHMASLGTISWHGEQVVKRHLTKMMQHKNIFQIDIAINHIMNISIVDEELRNITRQYNGRIPHPTTVQLRRDNVNSKRFISKMAMYRLCAWLSSYPKQHGQLWVNSSPPGAAYMIQWTGQTLVQVMACRLFGVKPLPEPMMTYWQLDP